MDFVNKLPDGIAITMFMNSLTIARMQQVYYFSFLTVFHSESCVFGQLPSGIRSVKTAVNAVTAIKTGGDSDGGGARAGEGGRRYELFVHATAARHPNAVRTDSLETLERVNKDTTVRTTPMYAARCLVS